MKTYEPEWSLNSIHIYHAVKQLHPGTQERAGIIKELNDM